MDAALKSIKQIIPGEKWFMKYALPNGETGTHRLVCWALCADEAGEDFVTGMIAAPDGALKPCCNLSGFSGYECEEME